MCMHELFIVRKLDKRHLLRYTSPSLIERWNAILTMRALMDWRDDGSLFYASIVNREDSGGSTEVLISVDARVSLLALLCSEPSAQ